MPKAIYDMNHRLGFDGKDGKVWAARKSPVRAKVRVNPRLAIKKFRKNHPVKDLQEEIRLQKIAARSSLAPAIHSYDLKEKQIVMTRLKSTLLDEMVKTEGQLSLARQKAVLKLIKDINQCGIFHKDPSPLNIMYDSYGRIFLIDFGMAEQSSSEENVHKMILGLLLHFNKYFVDKEYNILSKCLPDTLRTLLS